MPKLDLKREFKDLYAASANKPAIVDPPPFRMLVIDGEGAPGRSKEFQPAAEAIYGVAYAVKFEAKKADPAHDFTVMPLEGLWWMSDHGAFDLKRPSDWRWTLMMALPDFVTDDQVAAAKHSVEAKKPTIPAPGVRVQTFDEGTCVQLLHIGPYDQEDPTIERMEEFARDQGYALAGKHHEIYLSDPYRVAPEKLKTILRTPVQPLLRDSD